MRRNQPTLSVISYRNLDDTAKCLIPEMNAASLNLTNSISQYLNTAPVVVNQLRVMEIGKVYEIGPVLPLHANWYVVRLTAISPIMTRIEMLPSRDRSDITSTFEQALNRCA